MTDLDLDHIVAIAADLDAPENEEYLRGMVELAATLANGHPDLSEDFEHRQNEIEVRIRREYAIREWEASKDRATRDADLAEWHIVHLRSGHVYHRSHQHYTRGNGSDQAWRFPEV